MTPDELEKELKSGSIRPVYLIAGEERYLSEQSVRALRSKCVDPATADFNEDIFTAGETRVDHVLGAVRTVPMMAERRFVLVRNLERWEGRSEEKEGPLDILVKYADHPNPSTCLVLLAGKLDQRRKLAATAKKQGYLVHCEPLDRRALKGWIDRVVKERGHSLEHGMAEHLAEIAGPELGYVADAIERLSLFVGPKGKITAQAIADVVTRIREVDVWGLAKAVGDRDFSKAFSLMDQVYTPYEGIRLVGLIASSVRKLLTFSLALRNGTSAEEAAKTAGILPFKVREAVAQARVIPIEELERWMFLLAEADGSLKSSRRPERAVLDGLLFDMIGSQA